MKKLQSGLEIAENSEVLIAIVKVISEIACDYSTVFREHFSVSSFHYIILLEKSPL